MNKKLRILLGGDVFLGGEYIRKYENGRAGLFDAFQQITPILTENDIVFINLEGPLFKSEYAREDSTAILNNHPDVINYFKQFRYCIFNLANNHIMDYGEESLSQTIEILSQNNIFFLGAGKNRNAASEELRINTEDIRFAFLSYTSDEPNVSSILAGSNRAGCASFLEKDKITSKVKDLKQEVDFLGIALHWGYEYFQYPSESQVSFAHQLVDAGADLIIGHHPHVLQGVEQYKNAYIFYSLGNLFFPPFRYSTGRIKLQTSLEKQFMLAQIQFSKNSGIECKLIGGYRKERSNNYALSTYKGIAQAKFLRSIEKLSLPFKTNNYREFWSSYFNKRSRQLQMSQFFLAIRKIFLLKRKDLKEIKMSDFIRQFGRLRSLMSGR